MNDIWKILGIEPTDDRKVIRKAFAAQSRLHHPEEEPEYFAALNQAYKAALNYGSEAADGKSPNGLPEPKSKARKDPPEPDGNAEEIPPEQDRNAKEIPPEPEEKAESSLLKRLDEAAERTIRISMETGALRDFIALFENPKQAKQADTWKRFFLSEAFLEEQFSEEFGKGLLVYLSRQTLCALDCLPMGLLQELAIAYAFVPHFAGEEYFDGLKYPKEWYKVSVENTFPGRRYAAEIFNMQGRECDLKSMTGRILRQPANKVRHNAFSDYLAMREMNRDGRLTDREKEIWQQILGLCQPFYLYERNGKKPGSGAYESRSECVVKLYVQWLKAERLPEEVLLFLYKKLDFKTLDRSSTRGLYGALKAEVLRQLPRAEEILFGEEGMEQRITKLYRIYSAIINDNQNNYDKYIYEETPEIRERTRAFFALPDWKALKGEKGLFERIYSASKRIVMPRTLAETLAEQLAAGDYPEPERTELTESLLRSLSTERMCRELDYRGEISFRSAEAEDLGTNPDFWQYYLMRGFGFRHEKIRGSWEKDYIYVMDGECYLPAYINYIYAPSRAWQRRFVGFDEEKEEIEAPVSAVCSMPGNRKLRVEFHYHYCLYFVEEVPVTDPVLTFSQLQEYSGSLQAPEEFFFLLAVTAIEDSDRNAARMLTEEWLRRIPLHPFLIPVTARLLAADNDRISAEALVYEEQERFCFRGLVSEKGLSVWRQTDYGWQDIIFRSGELGWKKWEEYTWNQILGGSLLPGAPDFAEINLPDTPEDRKETARNFFRGLRQPDPALRAVYSLEGMDMEEKAEKILEAMGLSENPEGYCVLRYGEKKERRHDRVFYGAWTPFGFDLKAQSPSYESSRNYLMRSSEVKIKEPKVLAARFGWGFKYLPRSDYGPMYVYQGESGTFYAYGSVRMHRADRLDRLLADFFREEWEGVTEVETYEGCLTVSRLDHRLEYCYTEKDLRQSMSSQSDTAADRFTLFGGYGMWTEFVRWMDEMLNSGLPSWVNVVTVGLDWEKGGALTFAGIHEEDSHAEEDSYDEEDSHAEENSHDEEDSYDEEDIYAEDGDYAEEDTCDKDKEISDMCPGEVYLPPAPFLIWAKGMDRRDRAEFLNHALQWYADCGRFAEMTEGRDLRIFLSVS